MDVTLSADYYLPYLGRFTGASFDSRQVRPGMLYVALKGEKTDGHAFVAAALAAGAAFALVRADWPAPAGVDAARLIRVSDTRLGFGACAAAYRRTLSATVVGITGSAGKTTVKELTAAFLRAGDFKVHATAGNFNNDLGLPLTLLNCPKDSAFLILEMGTNHPGEIRYLVDIARPHVGLVSSIGTAHIEFFKTQEGIAAEKGMLLSGLSPSCDEVWGSFAVLARENARYEQLCAMCVAPVETVSTGDPEAAAFAAALKDRLPGPHNVLNALIAFGCARRFGVTLEGALKALEGFALPGGRWRRVERGGVRFVDDTYNANPTSMAAALETFKGMDKGVSGRKIVVLGDMFELGEGASKYHTEVLRLATTSGFDAVFAVGEQFVRAAASFAPSAVTPHACVADAAKALRAFLKPGDQVLLKASHGLHLEKVLDDPAAV